jgi:hypothetical protein
MKKFPHRFEDQKHAYGKKCGGVYHGGKDLRPLETVRMSITPAKARNPHSDPADSQ